LLDGVTGVFITGGDQMRLVSILGGTNFRAETAANGGGNRSRFSRNERGRGRNVHFDDRARRIDAASAEKLGAAFARIGFFKNIIIDQHFTERGRISRLITAVSYNPYNLGIGIDENTAIILDNEGVLEVFGAGNGDDCGRLANNL
jgi:cyanophycinase